MRLFFFFFVPFSAKMPIEYLGSVFLDQTATIPYWETLKVLALPVVAATALKMYTNGSVNTWERKLHGKVYIMTGGTSGIGASLAKEMAMKGAQLVLLTSQIGDEADSSARTWITDYVEDLRESTNNLMIYTEYCNLEDLYSIRKFATKWLDSKPARRLDGIICCAGESLPSGKIRTNSIDGVELQTQINYLGHYHLLTLLEPALRVQPPDRDVRVLVSSCLSQSMGQVMVNDITWEERKYPVNKPWIVYGTSKLMLNMFAKEFQRRIQSKERPDKQPCNVRVNIVNPGIVRSPSTRRFLSFGSVFGLLLYLLFYPIYWLLLKSCEMGCQSYLFALCSPDLHNMNGGNYIKECGLVQEPSMRELVDAELQATLYDNTAKVIEKIEKQSAVQRNKQKKKAGKENSGNDNAKKSKGKPSVNSDSAGSEKIKDELFQSVFAGDGAMYPDMSKISANDAERDARLRGLDAKFEARKQQNKNKSAKASGAEQT